jgi:hypothetical protein
MGYCPDKRKHFLSGPIEILIRVFTPTGARTFFTLLKEEGTSASVFFLIRIHLIFKPLLFFNYYEYGIKI